LFIVHLSSFIVRFQRAVSFLYAPASNKEERGGTMFETSVVAVQGRRSKGRIGLLTASIFAHTAIVLGAVGVSIASVDFPAVAPNEYRVAPTFSVPPPLGNPNAGRPAPVQPATTPVPPRPDVITAPPEIPDTITTNSEAPVAEAGEGTGDATGTGTGTEPGPVGVPWGVDGGVGDLDGPAVVTDVPVQVEEKIYQQHEVKAPVLVSKVEPRYPQLGARIGASPTVVVRCIIDRNGRVRDPEILVPASIALFNSAVVEAVSKWTFQPGTVRGQPVDSYFTLTVKFTVKR
jgi:TonB family protein